MRKEKLVVPEWTGPWDFAAAPLKVSVRRGFVNIRWVQKSLKLSQLPLMLLYIFLNSFCGTWCTPLPALRQLNLETLKTVKMEALLTVKQPLGKKWLKWLISECVDMFPSSCIGLWCTVFQWTLCKTQALLNNPIVVPGNHRNLTIYIFSIWTIGILNNARFAQGPLSSVVSCCVTLVGVRNLGIHFSNLMQSIGQVGWQWHRYKQFRL